MRARSALASPIGGDLASRLARESVCWRVNAERLVLLGWGRAILLQMAHPLVAAGVHEHSSFRATPWAAAARLHHTVQAMLSLTFGDEAARTRTLDAIRAIHRRVHGTLGEQVGIYAAGSPYSAEDPALVLWVHVTLIESVQLAYEQFIGPLTASERDAYCAEAAPVAMALGASEAEVPLTSRALRACIDRVYGSGVIAVGRQARELAEAVLAPRGAWIAAPATWINRTVTVGTLPGVVRSAYGFEWTPRDARRLTRLVSLLRSIRRVSPDRLALWPDSRALSAPLDHRSAGSDRRPSP